MRRNAAELQLQGLAEPWRMAFPGWGGGPKVDIVGRGLGFMALEDWDHLLSTSRSVQAWFQQMHRDEKEPLLTCGLDVTPWHRTLRCRPLDFPVLWMGPGAGPGRGHRSARAHAQRSGCGAVTPGGAGGAVAIGQVAGTWLAGWATGEVRPSAGDAGACR